MIYSGLRLDKKTACLGWRAKWEKKIVRLECSVKSDSLLILLKLYNDRKWLNHDMFYWHVASLKVSMCFHVQKLLFPPE